MLDRHASLPHFDEGLMNRPKSAEQSLGDHPPTSSGVGSNDRQHELKTFILYPLVAVFLPKTTAGSSM
jgi:hypothetical protein